jgi:hypothetical protein
MYSLILAYQPAQGISVRKDPEPPYGFTSRDLNI